MTKLKPWLTPNRIQSIIVYLFFQIFALEKLIVKILKNIKILQQKLPGFSCSQTIKQFNIVICIF